MKPLASIAVGTAAAYGATWLPPTWVTAVAWGLVCVCIALSVVDVLVWQIIRGLDDYVKSYEGPSDVFEEMLNRVGVVKRSAFILFLVNFAGRAFVATFAGAITAGKIGLETSQWMLPLAVGLAAASVPILIQQCVSYFFVSGEMAKQLLRAKRERERQEELKRLAARPSPMTESDAHTTGYTEVIPWEKPADG